MAQLDTSIYATRPRSVADFTAEADMADARKMGAESNRLQLLLQQGQLSQAKQAQDDDRALRMLYADPNFNIADPASQRRAMQVAPKSAISLIKANLDSQKVQGDIGKTAAETKGLTLDQSIKAHEFQVQKLGSVETPQEALAWAEDARRAGIFTPEQYVRGVAALQQASQTPQAFAQWKDQAMRGGVSVLEQLKLTTPDVKQVDIGGMIKTIDMNPRSNTFGKEVVAAQTKTQSPDSVASVGATLRGQNMVDARSREATALARAQGGKPPAGYRAKPDGTLEFIPGGPADPAAAKRAAPTEFQGKSAIFGTRAEEADRILTDLTGKYSPAAVNSKQAAGKVWGIGGALEAAGNLALSDAAQKAEQAQRDFVNAVLRQESGAVIAESEFANAAKQYFPQPGDSDAVIKQKAANRRTVIDGLKNNAGRALEGMPRNDGNGATGNWGPPDAKGRPPLASFGG